MQIYFHLGESSYTDVFWSVRGLCVCTKLLCAAAAKSALNNPSALWCRRRHLVFHC